MSGVSFGQTKKIEFLDGQFNPMADSASAKYIRYVEVLGDTAFKVQVNYRSNGQLWFTGNFLDKELTLESGWFEFFYFNGNKESEGRYKNGNKVGTWKRWNYDGRPKPDKFNPDEIHQRKQRITQPAKPEGGITGLQKFLADSLEYPAEALERNIEGTVYVTFIVDKNGDLRQTEVSRGVHYLLDDEALRLVTSMPSWSPAMRNGVPVESSFILPIVFNSKSAAHHRSHHDSKPK